ncbi:tetraspanin-1 [Hemicordylus capensis]|uniref:tetraspanin-1 n=1 Tax=Hemicordylus capensis TaxID=884348 RepID=UPI0023036C31|nr:tetraspanin-1 [Hemicordylus capensis]XP_053098678.1 tetraspanin-1 [Hemicordylus capensis]
MSCFTFLKVMMVLFNLAIVLGGGALLGTGIWVAVDRSSFIDVFGALSSSVLQIVNVGYVLIAIGAVLFLLGFLGCCGAQKESKCLLIMFFSIVLIIFIVEIAVAVLALVYTSLAETLLQGTVTQSLKNDFGKPNSEVTTIWNTTMHNLKCCGLSNFTDFNDSYYYNTNKEYPGICCNSLPVPCTYEIALSSNKTGCFPQLLSEVRSHAGAVGGVAAGICALEIAAMAVAMYLYCHLDEK